MVSSPDDAGVPAGSAHPGLLPQSDPVHAPAGDEEPGESVGDVSLLYLGNILYALERCALSLDGENKPADAAFYRGIGRKLAEAYRRARHAQEP